MITTKSWSFKTTTTTSAFQTLSTSSLYDNFQGSTYALKDGMTSPNGKWLDKWNGYGQAGVKTVSGYNVFYQIPKASTKSSETHSGLVVSKQKFSDITLDIDMKTYKQTRQNSPPNAWEASMGHVEVGRSLSPLLFRDKDERNRIWKERYEL